MNNNILLFGNVIAPIVASVFFFIYFIYFAIINNSGKSDTYKYFTVFLISFSIYIFGRPLQVLIEPYPIPLIVCNVRYFILYPICIPFSLFAIGVFSKNRDKNKKYLLFLFGFILALVYVVFNSLGTIGLYEIFKAGNITAYDLLTPSMKPPFYSREVTIATQAIAGLVLTGFPIYKIIKLRSHIILKNIFKNKNFLFHTGALIFGFTFLFGSVTKLWWVYYIGSMFYAVLFGSGILLEIKEVNLRIERVIPFMKEELIQNITLSISNEEKIKSMINILGKENIFDTIMVIKIEEEISDASKMLKNYDAIMNIINSKLDEKVEEENFLVIPLGFNLIGVCFSVLKKLQKDKSFIINIAEKIRESSEKDSLTSISIGIGRSYDNIKNLKYSYQEALNAVDCALNIGKNSVVHINDIQDSDQTSEQYPMKERKELLLAVKLGKGENISDLLNKFFEKLMILHNENQEIFKVRVNHLLSLIIDSAILGGGDEKKLTNILKKYFSEISNINNRGEIINYFQTILKEITENVITTKSKRRGVLIQKAVKFIEDNYVNQIMIEDVSKEVNLSPSYFKHIFKSETGFSFVDYLTKLRIKKAKDLLKDDHNVTEVAYMVGYQDSNYFSKVFKNIEGVSPSEYRKN